VVFLGFAVFIVAPIIFVNFPLLCALCFDELFSRQLFWNILLICLGRPPLQNPPVVSKPEIEKIPKSIIDSIPLVLYIPPPPNEPAGKPISVPEIVHGYPPKPAPVPPTKRRFRFLRRRLSDEKKKTDGSEVAKGDVSNENKASGEKKWEDCWEQGEYPFVRLEGNRAACAICLLDFAEPKRVADMDVADDAKAAERRTIADISPSPAEGEVQEIPIENPSEEVSEEQLKLADAGDGPQPLRLLECGHVFHVSGLILCYDSSC